VASVRSDGETFTVADLGAVSDAVAAVWTGAADRDWSVPAGTVEWSCLATADHAVDCVYAPAFFLASRRLDAYPDAGADLRLGARATPARLVESLAEPIHGGLPATIRKVCLGLLARLDGDSGTAATLLLEAEQEAVAWDRPYEAACIALEAAQALDGEGAALAQARAAAFLEPLGCVNPY